MELHDNWVIANGFFVKQKTAYEMRISDWSSDVCSSDLPDCWLARPGSGCDATCPRGGQCGTGTGVDEGQQVWPLSRTRQDQIRPLAEAIGRASCRERVCQYV